MNDPSLAVLTVPGRVDRVEADEARVARLGAAGRLGAVVRPAGGCPWWSDVDFGGPAADEPGLAWSGRFPRRRRRARLAEAVRASSSTPISAVLALGFPAWAEAKKLGDALGAGVLLGAREEAAVAAARRLVRVLNPTRCVLVAETQTLAEQLREATDNLLVVEVVPPGVAERPASTRRRAAGEPLLLGVPLEAGAAGLGAVLAGLDRVLRERAGVEVQLLMLGDPAALEAGHRVAAAAGRLGCVSAVPAERCSGGEGVPLPVVLDGVDAVLQPRAAAAEQPPAGLEAAARGLPVLAPAGGAAGATARELPRPDAEAWAASLAWLLDDPGVAAAAGAAARERVRATCAADASDAALLHLAGLVAAG